MILILPFVFICILVYRGRKEKDFFEGLVQAEILYHVCLLVITNLFSFGGLLNKWSVLSGWSAALFVTVLAATVQGVFFPEKQTIEKRAGRFVKDTPEKEQGASPKTFRKRSRELWDDFCMMERVMLCLLAVLFLVLFVGAVFTVPYNYDSMTYHLGRIGHWIDNGSVGHFVTNIDRQIYSPVLSEYEMLHMMLLADSDTFLNMLQYVSMIITGLILYRVSRKLGTSRAFSMMAAFLFYTMPLTVSQSVTTQNDLLAAMWFAAFLYYFIDFIQAEKLCFDMEQRKKLVMIGACVAFAFLTKTSICASMLFFMPWLLAVCIKRKDKLVRIIQSGVLAGAVLLVLISETLVRTYLSCGRLMADTTSANIMVATKNIKYIIVNICKNFSLLITQHIFRPLNGVVYRFAIRLGSMLGVDFNNEAISYHGFDFLHHMNMGEDMYSHDKTSSAVVTYLALLAGILLLAAIVMKIADCIAKGKMGKQTGKQKRQGQAFRPVEDDGKKWYQCMSIGFAVSAWLSLGFIMALLRWQPWGTRLMYPALAMTVVMTANVAGGFVKDKKADGGKKSGEDKKADGRREGRGQVILAVIVLLSTVFCIRPTVYNMKPAVENVQAGCKDRMARYFRFNDRYTAYGQLIDKTEELGVTKIGLSISGDGYDYPLWLMYRRADKTVRLYHVILDEDDANDMDGQTEFPECILYVEHGTIAVGESVTYHGTQYECVYVSDVNPDAPDAVLVRK